MPGHNMLYLQAEEPRLGKLLKILFANIIDNKWPPANAADIDEWKFSCMVHGELDNYKAFDMVYYDYRGGDLHDASDATELEQLIEEADILLGLIDGQQILKSLRKEQNTHFVVTELDAVLSHIGRQHTKEKPVHLIISKWDLLKSHNFGLADVRDMLLSIPKFNEFADNIDKKKGLVRLIPVSSVGFDLIDYEKSNEGMIVKEEGKLEPFQVDYPIALAIMDKFRMRHAALLEEEKEKLASQESIKPSFWKKFWGGLQIFAGKALDFVSLENWGEYFRLSGEELKAQAEAECQAMKDILQTEILKVQDDASALDYAFDAFKEIQFALDKDFPESKL
jgi:hypothetical protein